MSTEIESQIDSCLAYEVLRNPENWIGSPSTEFLEAFLYGAQLRANCVKSDLPLSRISGVLDEPAFYKQFVDATGHPLLTIRWATALAMTHFSLEAGFATLKDQALAWHRMNGIAMNSQSKLRWIDPDRFWDGLAARPALYIYNQLGWTLFCFFNGMDRGGDWLQLPEMPRLREVFASIKRHSESHYGSPFAAFRVYDAHHLLAWAGLGPVPEINES